DRDEDRDGRRARRGLGALRGLEDPRLGLRLRPGHPGPEPRRRMSTPETTGTSGAGFATNPAFRALLTAASGATGADLDALVGEIRDLELLLAPDAGGEPAALAAYRRIDGFAVEIEYLAVAPALQNQGLATALV